MTEDERPEKERKREADLWPEDPGPGQENSNFMKSVSFMIALSVSMIQEKDFGIHKKPRYAHLHLE